MVAAAGDPAAPPASRRSLAARVGLAALSVFVPGLGLVRLGRWRLGLGFMAAPLVVLPLLALVLGTVRVVGHGQLVAAVAAALALGAAPSVVASVLTWRASRERREPRPVWARWYAVFGIGLVAVAAFQLVAEAGRSFHRVFDIPAASMAPTLAVGDRLVADMCWRGPPRRGDIVLFDRGGTVWVKRVVGLPGDRIAMRGGVPTINGEAAAQVPARPVRVEDQGALTLQSLVERLRGAASPHVILDGGAGSPLATWQEVTVPQGALFVLGDHRGNSLVSRVPAELGGVGMVPLSAVVGRPLCTAYARDRSRIGMALDR